MLIGYNRLSKKMKILEIILLVLIGLNLAFIFIQSALPPQVVEEETEIVKDIVEEILPPDSDAAEYTESNTDKIAHFVEFGTLGIFVSLFISLYSLMPKILAPLSLLFAQLVAIIDETIQIFSGRCSDIVDVWMDLLGFATLSTIIYIACFIIKFVKRKKER